MKFKKLKETLKQAQETVEQANKALNSAMEALSDEDLEKVAGAGNPFGDISRVPTQSIDDDMRNNG